MAVFRGLARTDYQDLLRSVGRYLDQNGFTRIRLVETEDGLVVQGMVARGRAERRMESYLLSAEDLQAMVDADMARRRPPQS